MRTLFTVASLILSTTSLFAHVRVRPAESRVAATETYTMRVPSERGLTTKSVALTVPDGVTIVSVGVVKGVTSVTFDEKRAGDRPATVTWTIEIKPGEAAELTFVAQNPAEGATIAWPVHQNYTDGSTSAWVGPKGDKAPAPVSTLTTSATK